MCPARPVKILFFKVFFATQLTNLLIYVKIPSIFEFLYPLSHFIPLILQSFNRFITLGELILPLPRVTLCCFKVIVQLIHSLFENSHEFFLIFLHFFKGFC